MRFTALLSPALPLVTGCGKKATLEAGPAARANLDRLRKLMDVR